jgi:hypothetical protein
MQYSEEHPPGGVILASAFDVSNTPLITVDAIFSNVTVEDCPDAEGRFLDAARQVLHPERSYGQPEVVVYYNSDGIPLLFRKRTASNALTLQDVNFIGVESRLTPQPDTSYRAAGSIVEVSSHMSVQRTAGGRMPGGWSLSMLRVDGPLVIGTGRDSVWSEDSADGTARTMDPFRAVALHAMECLELL